jgi:hypothetical protein
VEAIFYGCAAVVFVFFIFNLLRKLHWDAIQINLLELADTIGGSVIRKGILARPIYHGRYQDKDLTINFSTDRTGGKRNNFIDISIGMNLKNVYTISSLEWIRESSAGSIGDFVPLELTTDVEYGIRQSKGEKLAGKAESAKIKNYIRELDPFRFLHVSQNGILFEKEGENLGISTKHPKLKQQIDTLFGLIQTVEGK